jgi:membrane protease YdiL (CAAX protease family)
VLIAVATFAGVLWVLAVAEEFFFRGLLQQMLTSVLGSRTAGLVLASLIFGAVHLPYRAFPNWHFAVLAACAGLFYGRAYQQAGSIRAAMVTHALVVTVWKTFLM